MDHHRLSVEREIAADPSTIFAILSDASRHAEIDGSGTVRGSKGPSDSLSLGSVFGISMKMGLPYSTKNTVVEHEPDRRIAWQTKLFGGIIGGRIWRYELEPTATGTQVTETWDLNQDKQRLFLERSTMPAKTTKDMRRTLDRLAAAVER